MRCPSWIPAGTSSSSGTSSRIRPSPSQRSQGCSTIVPTPSQRGQAPVRTICPSTVRETCWMRPAPPHPGHVVGAVPGAAPLPPHAWHVLATRTPTSRVVPVTASARSISTWAATSGPRAGPAGPPAACPKSASPKKAAKTSERLPKSASIGAYPPLRRPAWPNRSYVRRRSGSDSTSYASATARNRCPASGSSLTSGWSSRASRRNARLISSWLASRGTPSRA